MGSIKTFAKDTVIYGLGSGIKKFIGIFLLPFYTRALSPADYGILDTISTCIFFMSTFLNVGLDSATALFFYQAKTEEEKGKVLYTVFILRIITIFPILFLSLFSSQISVALFGSAKYSWAIFISCLIIPVTLITNEQERIYRLFREPWKFNNLTILKSLFNVGLGIGLVVILHAGILGAQVASFGSSLLIVIFSFFYFTKGKYAYKFSWYWAKQMLKYGFPIIWAGLAQWVFISSDRFFLLHYKDLTQIGYYSIGSTFSQPISLVSMAIQMSFSVLFFSIYNEEENLLKPKSKQFAIKILNITLIICVLIALLLSIFGTNIILFVTTPAYYQGALAIPFLCFANIAALILQISMMGIELSKKTWHFTWLMAVAAIVNVALNFYFIPKYGFVGAAFTTFFANFIYLVMAYFVSQYYFKIDYKIIKLSAYFVLGLLLCLIVPFSELFFHYNINFLMKIILCFFGFSLPLLFRLVHVSDFKSVLKLLMNKNLKV